MLTARTIFCQLAKCRTLGNRLASSLVLAEHDGKKVNPITLNTVTAAAQLGDVCVLVAGSSVADVVGQVSKVEGVKKVIVADDKHLESQLPELVSAVVLAAQNQFKFDAIAAGSSAFGRGVIPRIAGKLNLSPISDVTAIHSSDTFSRSIYAGNAICKVKSLSSIKLMTIRSTSFKPANTAGVSGAATEKVNVGDKWDNRSEFLGQELTKSSRPDLQSAKIIVSGGRGVGSAESFKLIYELADKLGAGVGASRAAVDAGFVPNDLQVGQTGKIVAPELYIAIGISGAIQHLAGMKDSKVIVAINKDGDAPIFQVADFGLKADLFKAVPEMIKLL